MDAKDLLLKILQSLANEEQINIEVDNKTEGTVIYNASIPKRCIGQVLGKQGRTADSIRYIMQCIHKAKHEMVYININESEE